jgi:hypothetical protein
MKKRKIQYCLDRAAHFRALSDPESNHLMATHTTTVLADTAARRAQWWEDRAAQLLAEGLAKRAKRKRPKT